MSLIFIWKSDLNKFHLNKYSSPQNSSYTLVSYINTLKDFCRDDSPIATMNSIRFNFKIKTKIKNYCKNKKMKVMRSEEILQANSVASKRESHRELVESPRWI